MITSKRIINLLSIILLTTLLGSACQAQPAADPSKSPSGKVIYEDDFSDEKSGWQVIDSEQGFLGYKDGAYNILLKVPAFTSWMTAQKIFNSVNIEADVTKTDGPDESAYGIICRMEDDMNFYLFVISSTGHFGIGKVVEGKGPIMLGSDAPDKLLASDAIKKGNETNHLLAECSDSTLTFTVNGKQLLSVQDHDLEAGDIGFLVKTFDKPGIDVKFDNLVVKMP